MNLKQLLKMAGVSNDIAKEVLRKSEKTSEQEEIEHQERAMAMAKVMINEALRANQTAQNRPPVPKKRTIIIPD